MVDIISNETTTNVEEFEGGTVVEAVGKLRVVAGWGRGRAGFAL
jgi:hypothetical protein